MKTLVVGSGGREHAIADTLAQSPRVSKVFSAPGNAGTRLVGENLPVGADDLPGLAAAAETNGIELTVVGPEVPLSLGVVDLFRGRGLPVIGPTAAGARLEASKAFAKHLCDRQKIPTAAYVECGTPEEA